jgi:predicted metal-dependent phosphoesterase TrpH
VLETLRQTPGGKKLIGQVEFTEKDGSSVSIVIESSTMTDFAVDKKASLAYLDVEKAGGGYEALEIPQGDAISSGVLTYEDVPWRLKEVRDDSIVVSNPRLSDVTISEKNKQGISLTTGNKNNQESKVIILKSTELHREAHIIVSPNVEKAFSSANFNLHLNVEKRAIDLPLFSDSIEEEINKTEKLIKKLDKTLEKVGKIHDSWKKFCFGVYAAIAAWNFLKAIVDAGGGRAKQQAADVFWQQKQEMCEKERLTLDECVFKYQDKYDTILRNTEDAYEYADDIGGTYQRYEVTENNKEEMENLAYLEKQAENNPDNLNSQKEYLVALRATQEREDYAGLLEAKGKTTGTLTSEEKQEIARDMKSLRAGRLDSLKTELSSNPKMLSYLEMIEMGKSYNLRPSYNKVYAGDLTKIGDLGTKKDGIMAEEIKAEKEKILLIDPTKDPLVA